MKSISSFLRKSSPSRHRFYEKRTIFSLSIIVQNSFQMMKVLFIAIFDAFQKYIGIIYRFVSVIIANRKDDKNLRKHALNVSNRPNRLHIVRNGRMGQFICRFSHKDENFHELFSAKRTAANFRKSYEITFRRIHTE